MNKADFKEAFGLARKTRTGFEFLANGRLAYCGTESVMYLDENRTIERGKHYALEMIATCRELGLRSAAFRILTTLKANQVASCKGEKDV